MYSGLLPLRNGAHANHWPARAGTVSIAQRLGALGYRVALAGKLHVGPREVFPFEYVPGGNAPEPGRERAGVLYTDLQVDAIDRWLAARDTARDARPFALVVGEHSPHTVWPESTTYDPARVDVPPALLDTPELRRARARYYEDVTKMDRNVGRLLASLRRRGLLDGTLFVYTADQGAQFPFGKWGLYEAGIRAPLMMRWPGRVRAGRSDALVSLVDLLPTFIEAAGGSAPDSLDGRSLVPLLLGGARAVRDTVFAAHTGDGDFNRAPMRMVRTARHKYIANLAPDVLYTTHVDLVRDSGGRQYWPSWVRRAAAGDDRAAAMLWRYHHRPAEELYDLDTDPAERRNLVVDPAHARTLAALRGSMRAWRAAQGDTVTGPEPLGARRGAGPPYLTPKP
jgi:uncharacterized sulfatase